MPEHERRTLSDETLDRDRAAAVTLQREIMGRPLPYNRIEMRRPEPPPEVAAAYTELFGIRPLFGQAREAGSFDASHLHMPLPQADAHTMAAEPVPLHLRNAPTRLMKDLDYGKGYQYAHDAPDAQVSQEHLPDALRGHIYYRPTERGAEKEIGEESMAVGGHRNQVYRF